MAKFFYRTRILSFTDIKPYGMIGAVSILLTAGAYLLYYFITQNPVLRRKLLGPEPTTRHWLRQMWFQKGAGVVLMGVLPAIGIGLCCPELFRDMGLGRPGFVAHWPWYAGGMGLMYVLSTFGARQPDTQARYPEMQIETWTRKTFALSTAGWIAYLAAYEFLFRGVLLFGCYAAFGKWPAVAINIALYAFAHIVKGWPETLGSILFGVISCLAALHIGTVWLPFLAHIVTSVNSEYLCIKWRKDMQFA